MKILLARRTIFKLLKNGKEIQLFYKSNAINYTIHLTFKNSVFFINSYHFAGDDVFDESNYQNEQTENFDNFQIFFNRLIEKFPGIEYP